MTRRPIPTLLVIDGDRVHAKPVEQMTVLELLQDCLLLAEAQDARRRGIMPPVRPARPVLTLIDGGRA